MAAQGQVVFYDDTPNRILDQSDLVHDRKALRKGVYTTAVVSQIERRVVYLFYTSERYAAENIEKLWVHRDRSSAELITMSDASANNLPKEVPDDLLARWILCFCLVHGQGKFYQIFNFFESECDYVLQQIGEVYHHEKICRQKGFNGQERLAYHQTHSAPIDNSICEQAIKVVIRHRRNSLFYKSRFGAQVGDTLMSVIHTAARNGVNVLEYLNTLPIHAHEVAGSPEEWLPWTYRYTLESQTWRQAAE